VTGPGPRPTSEYGSLDLLTPSSPVERIMSAPAYSIEVTATIREAAHALAEARVGALVVVEHGMPAGMVSERDVVQMLADKLDPDRCQVADILNEHIVWARPDDSITHVAGLMRLAGIRHVPVRNEFGLLGMVSLRDVLDALLPGATAAC
jgi:CBS domain-containing protein